jgi:hypothetical protein
LLWFLAVVLAGYRLSEIPAQPDTGSARGGELSSAILYVAIVVIWACVLIPRWLRRDSSAAVPESDGASSSSSSSVGSVEPEVEESPEPEPVPRRGREAGAREAGARERLGEPVAADPGHRRVLAARRRLLLMLLMLSVASGVLAETRMAAWWVIVPPSVMLFGYLLMLREAARADAERQEMARYRMARKAAERRSGAAAHVTPVSAVAPGAASAAQGAPAAKIIAFLPPPEEEIYDQYTDAKLRAVGD